MRLQARWVTIGFLAAAAATVGVPFAQARSVLDKNHRQSVCPKDYQPFLEFCMSASTGDIVNPVQRNGVPSEGTLRDVRKHSR